VKGGTLNFERAPLKLQRVIKSKEKRARETERRERGSRSGGGGAGEPGQLVKKEKIRGKGLGSPKNKIQALDNP